MANAATRKVLERLIGFDTTSANSNLALMEYVQSLLSEHDIDNTLVYNKEENKANLYATIGPKDKPGIMLSGHTDTVPIAGQPWTVPAYELTESAGRFYGRGTTDMKGFIAAVLGALPQMTEKPLTTPLHLAFSYDEEIGCIGVRRLIDTLKSHPTKPALCIIGEPTSMQVVTAHKGKIAMRVKVHGKACHSGLAPQGVNAINYAARLVAHIDAMARERIQNGPFEDGYEIPHTTLHTGVIKGGNALNIVPSYCEFDFEIRNIASEDPKTLVAEIQQQAAILSEEMQAISDDTRIEFELLSEYPGLSTANDLDAVTLVQRLAECSKTGTVPFGTEGGLFHQHLGVTTVVCGPGSMDQGHKPDEYIEATQLAHCEQFLERLIDYCR